MKWVEPDNFHLTYAFLGELGPEASGSARNALAAGVDGIKAFDMTLGSFGVFPSPRRPSVLWVGISEGAAQLRDLAGRIAVALSGKGIFFEDRFSPHITIGRVKGTLPDNFMRRMGGYSPSRTVRGRLSSVELTESVLSQEGPEYRPVCSFRLL